MTLFDLLVLAVISRFFSTFVPAFDTSCFSGKYVTGETIDDEYFQRLYNVRNEAAKQERNNGSGMASAVQSNDGCESVANDKSGVNAAGGACDGLANDIAARS